MQLQRPDRCAKRPDQHHAFQRDVGHARAFAQQSTERRKDERRGNAEGGEEELHGPRKSTKHQVRISREIPNPKLQIPKASAQALEFGAWSLVLGAFLELGPWSLVLSF